MIRLPTSNVNHGQRQIRQRHDCTSSECNPCSRFKLKLSYKYTIHLQACCGLLAFLWCVLLWSAVQHNRKWAIPHQLRSWWSWNAECINLNMEMQVYCEYPHWKVSLPSQYHTACSSKTIVELQEKTLFIHRRKAFKQFYMINKYGAEGEKNHWSRMYRQAHIFSSKSKHDLKSRDSYCQSRLKIMKANARIVRHGKMLVKSSSY